MPRLSSGLAQRPLQGHSYQCKSRREEVVTSSLGRQASEARQAETDNEKLARKPEESDHGSARKGGREEEGNGDHVERRD